MPKVRERSTWVEVDDKSTQTPERWRERRTTERVERGRVIKRKTKPQEASSSGRKPDEAGETCWEGRNVPQVMFGDLTRCQRKNRRRKADGKRKRGGKRVVRRETLETMFFTFWSNSFNAASNHFQHSCLRWNWVHPFIRLLPSPASGVLTDRTTYVHSSVRAPVRAPVHLPVHPSSWRLAKNRRLEPGQWARILGLGELFTHVFLSTMEDNQLTNLAFFSATFEAQIRSKSWSGKDCGYEECSGTGGVRGPSLTGD